MAPAAVKSNARQKAGHHAGTPGFVASDPWTASNTACPVVLANSDLNDKLEVVSFLRFAPVAVVSVLFRSLVLSFRSRAVLQLEILALRH
jgi:hypothetical protein